MFFKKELLIGLLCLFIGNIIFAANDSLPRLRFLDEYDVPYRFSFQQTIVGGLSGINYNEYTKQYIVLSDDRAVKNAARFYTLNISIKENKIDTIQFLKVNYLLNKQGIRFPPYSCDPEAIRYNSIQNKYVWSSEGERRVNAKDTVLQNPFIYEMNDDGKYADSFELPPQFYVSVSEKGPRQNGVFEGLSFSPNFKWLWVSTEEPLWQDGPPAGYNDDAPAFSRIIKYNAVTRKPVAQYAYRLEPVAHKASSETAYKINGISEILALNEEQLLVVERSFSTGKLHCTVRVFIADASKASNIMQLKSLKEQNFTAMPKTLVLNMDSLGIYIDNIEAVTFGPTLPNGHKTLIFVSDNNFSVFEKTQFLLFELME